MKKNSDNTGADKVADIRCILHINLLLAILLSIAAGVFCYGKSQPCKCAYIYVRPYIMSDDGALFYKITEEYLRIYGPEEFTEQAQYGELVTVLDKSNFGVTVDENYDKTKEDLRFYGCNVYKYKDSDNIYVAGSPEGDAYFEKVASGTDFDTEMTASEFLEANNITDGEIKGFRITESVTGEVRYMDDTETLELFRKYFSDADSTYRADYTDEQTRRLRAAGKPYYISVHTYNGAPFRFRYYPEIAVLEGTDMYFELSEAANAWFNGQVNETAVTEYIDFGIYNSGGVVKEEYRQPSKILYFSYAVAAIFMIFATTPLTVTIKENDKRYSALLYSVSVTYDKESGRKKISVLTVFRKKL